MKLYFCNYPGGMVLVTNHVPTVTTLGEVNGEPLAIFTYRENREDEISTLYRHCIVANRCLPPIPENKIVTLEVN